MGIYKYIRNTWKKPKTNPFWQERLILWRRQPVTVRIERPTRLDRARSLGYRAKQGIIIVRQRVIRGGHKRPQIKGGRTSKNQRQRMALRMNYQTIAEQRAAKKYKNCEVLNSYEVAKDGQHYWYEIILVDRAHPSSLKDKQLRQIAKQKGRVFRGKTSASLKSRGLRKKGKGVEKLRPSRKARGY
jgi:large subunit ribosomal protein L15e